MQPTSISSPSQLSRPPVGTGPRRRRRRRRTRLHLLLQLRSVTRLYAGTVEFVFGIMVLFYLGVMAVVCIILALVSGLFWR